MLRLLVILTLAAVVAYFGSTVKLGERTFFGHIRAIWSTKEAQDMRKGLDEKAGPALDRMKRGVEAGIKAAGGDDGGSPPADAGVSDAPADAAVLPEAPAPDERPATEPAKSPEKSPSEKKGAKDKKDVKKPDKITTRDPSLPLPWRGLAAALPSASLAAQSSACLAAQPSPLPSASLAAQSSACLAALPSPLPSASLAAQPAAFLSPAPASCSPASAA